MTTNYEQAPRFSATGVTTVAIVATILAMGLSMIVDLRPTSDDAARAAPQVNSPTRS